MKIAIASETPDPATQIAMHAARAPYYLIYNDNRTLLAAIKNPYADIERGAAPKAAQLLKQAGVTELIAGEFGNRFVDELEACHIRAVTGSGQIAGIIQNVVH